MNNILIRTIVATASLMLMFIVLTPQIAFAAPQNNCRQSFLGIPSWYKYLPLDSECNVNKDSPKINGNEGRIIIFIMLALFEAALYIAGFVAIIFIIYGGFKFLTSLGEPQKIAGARTTILNALIGLAIAILASRVVSYIGRSFF